MKNRIITISFTAFVIILFAFGCEKKKSTGIAPSYEATGNPNPGYQTVTGTTTYTSPATENTSLIVGGSGWTNPTCGSTKSITLKGFNGNIDVTLSFASAIKTQTYQVAPMPGPNICAMRVINAPGQPAGIVWIGKTGTVTVNTTSASINAAFNSITCTQASFNFPAVTVSGVLGCSQ